MTKKLIALSLVATLAAAAIADDKPYVDTSDEAMRSAQGLYPVKNAAMAAVFAKPGANLADYDQFILDEVIIAYKKTRKSRSAGSLIRTRSHLDDDETAEMQFIFNEVFAKALAKDDGYKIGDTAGDSTLRITPYILDLVINVPLEMTAGRSRVYVDSVADMTLVLEFRDSVSGELLVQAAERRAARNVGHMQLSSSIHDRRQVKRLLEHWATLLRDRFDALHELQIEGK